MIAAGLASVGVLSNEEIRAIVARVHYKDWRLIVRVSCETVLWVEFDAPDAYSPDGKPLPQRGRPWILEPRSASELLQTIWLAIITAEEHEAREIFTYDGRKIFNPHKNHQLAVSI